MRRLFFVAVVALLGITSLLGGRVPASAQGGSDDFEIIITADLPWEKVSRPRPVGEVTPLGGAGTLPIEKVQPYEVLFAEEAASVPVIENAEFMLVAVQDGTFVLDLAPATEADLSPYGSFLVHPSGGESIPVMTATGYPEPGPHYVPTGGKVPNAAGTADCTSMCLIPAEVAVQVKRGDRIVAREGAICIWCLLNQPNAQGEVKGLLLVSPTIPMTEDADEFSWMAAWDTTVASFNAQTQTVRIDAEGTDSMSGEPVKMGWAFLNPGTNCKS